MKKSLCVAFKWLGYLHLYLPEYLSILESSRLVPLVFYKGDPGRDPAAILSYDLDCLHYMGKLMRSKPWFLSVLLCVRSSLAALVLQYTQYRAFALFKLEMIPNFGHFVICFGPTLLLFLVIFGVFLHFTTCAFTYVPPPVFCVSSYHQLLLATVIRCREICFWLAVRWKFGEIGNNCKWKVRGWKYTNFTLKSYWLVETGQHIFLHTFF